MLCIALDAHLHENKCISWICRLRPDLRVVPNTSNTIKLILLKSTALVISTEVSFTVMDQWQRGREGGKTKTLWREGGKTKTLWKQCIICQKKLRSSQPEGMLFWKSIFLPRGSSSNIMRRPLNKTLKTKKSGKDSHTKVIQLAELNHSESHWLLQKPKKKTPEMPVFKRWASCGTLSKTKREMEVMKGTDGRRKEFKLNTISNGFHPIEPKKQSIQLKWGRLHNLNLDLMTKMWKFLSNSYQNFTTYICTDIWPLFYNINPLT